MNTTATPTKPAAKSAALKKTPTKASTSVALKKTSTSLVSIKEIQDQLAKQREGLKDRVAPPTGMKIRATQDKKFILPDGTTTPGPLELVIVDFVAANNFYDGPYDEKNIVPPDCFAVGTDPKKMFPSANVPNKQSDDCQTCPMNQWGSNPNGRGGKACGNGRLLAVLPPDATEDTPIWTLQPSSTAIKGFDGYVAGVARSHQSMPIQVVTTVSFDDNETYAKMIFSDPKVNDNLASHFARQEEARALLFAERDVSGYVAPAPVKGAKKPVARR